MLSDQLAIRSNSLGQSIGSIATLATLADGRSSVNKCYWVLRLVAELVAELEAAEQRHSTGDFPRLSTKIAHEMARSNA